MGDLQYLVAARGVTLGLSEHIFGNVELKDTMPIHVCHSDVFATSLERIKVHS